MIIHPMLSFQGTITASPSKSHSHRVLFLALGATTPTIIKNLLHSRDIEVTLDFCRNCGAIIKENLEHHNTLELVPPLEGKWKKFDVFNGKNSGFSIRTITALTGLITQSMTLTGQFFDRNRPLIPLLHALAPLGYQWTFLESPRGIEIHVSHLIPCDMSISGRISSQFISSLLLAIPQYPSEEKCRLNPIRLTIADRISSFPYLKITEEMLRTFNITFSGTLSEDLGGYYEIIPGQSFPGISYTVPGDFSSAAYPLVAAVLNPFPETVIITDLDMHSPQGDKKIIEILTQMGAHIEIDSPTKSILILGGKSLKGIAIDCAQIPDLFPILLVTSLFADQETLFLNTTHVRQKESDRVAIMIRELRKMGAYIEYDEHGKHDQVISVQGPEQLTGAHFYHEQDHRVAMALTIAGLFARSDSTMDHPEIVGDSYPQFFHDLEIIGAKFVK